MATTALAGSLRSQSGADESVLRAAHALEMAWAKHHGPLTPLVFAAAQLAVRAHEGQLRLSGECYASHPLEVAALVAELGFDGEAVAAACCHDILEDTEISPSELERLTNGTVLALVEALTKVDHARGLTHREAAAASVTKLIVSVAGDVRAIAIKLADRLHNVRTIGSLPPERQKRMAQESIEIFAPLAHRLGMETLRFELEDLCFAVLYPDEYAALAASIEGLGLKALAEHAASSLSSALFDAGLVADVSARSKHLWSIFSKLQTTSGELSGLHDLVGVRVLVADVPQCYQALGVVHSLWPPLAGRFKDYIALPKTNGYQSLHTTCITEPREVEVQLRTRKMHLQAAYGIAAHYLYKANATDRSRQDDELVAALSNATDPEAFYDLLRAELAPDGEIVVLTPKGDAIALPTGSTPIDFAYKIHTAVGNSCVGVRINGRLAPIRSQLHTGDVVEITRSKTGTPSRDWLEVVQTAKARERIRRFFADKNTAKLESGRALLRKELEARGAAELINDESFLSQLARFASVQSVDVLFEKLVSKELSPSKLRGLPPRRPKKKRRLDEENEPVLDLPFSIAECCRPTATDDVVGYVSKSHTISIHRSDCANYRAMIRALPPGEVGRLIAVPGKVTTRRFVEVRSGDRPGLLRDLTDVFASLSVNIGSVESVVGSGHLVISRFEVHLADHAHLEAVLRRLREVPSVANVESSTR